MLKKEVVDALDRLSLSHPLVQSRAVVSFLNAMKSSEQRFGPFNNLSNDRRRELAKTFKDVARETYDNDVGGASALFLISAYLEASALPGDDAASALSLVTQYHRQAQALESAALKDMES